MRSMSSRPRPHSRSCASRRSRTQSARTRCSAAFSHAQIFGFAAFQPGWREFAGVAEARGLPFHGLYGSSEVQALFSISRSDAPFADRIEPGGVPMSPDAIVRVRDTESGALAPAGVSG